MKTRLTLSSFFMVWALVVGALVGDADSLFNGSGRSMFSDVKAFNVGDIVTIIITETSSATSTANTSTSKESNTSVGPGTGKILKQFPPLSFQGSGANTAAGTTARTGTLIASMTARVVRVLPNGNLEIEGMREIMVNSENQKMVLTGTVRAVDIAPDNTIRSTFIADAKIRYEGKGIIGQKQREGVISRLLHWLF
jgi:flagellar L-ring protein precursor FlgH